MELLGKAGMPVGEWLDTGAILAPLFLCLSLARALSFS
eukprot:COSAG05_NODE_19221_length_296_cov_0.619289_1_plen_37_part_01